MGARTLRLLVVLAEIRRNRVFAVYGRPEWGRVQKSGHHNSTAARLMTITPVLIGSQNGANLVNCRQIFGIFEFRKACVLAGERHGRSTVSLFFSLNRIGACFDFEGRRERQTGTRATRQQLEF